MPEPRKQKWDIFISYASEDREEVAKPLVRELSKLGLEVWFDQTQLLVGDSLRRKIDNGLSLARFGVVILSSSFFTKEWPQKELDALVSMDSDERPRLFPVLFDLNHADVQVRSPLLAGRVATLWSKGVQNVVQDIFTAIDTHSGGYYTVESVASSAWIASFPQRPPIVLVFWPDGRFRLIGSLPTDFRQADPEYGEWTQAGPTVSATFGFYYFDCFIDRADYGRSMKVKSGFGLDVYGPLIAYRDSFERFS